MRRLGMKSSGKDWVTNFDEVTTTLSNIAETPLAYLNVHRGTRRAVIRRFPLVSIFK